MKHDTRNVLFRPSEFLDHGKADWTSLYAFMFEWLNGVAATHTLLPFGDPNFHTVSGTTLTGQRFHGSGLAPTWTTSSAVNAWDTAFANAKSNHAGPAQIPFLVFNGTDEEMDTPNAGFWTATTTAIGMWVKVDSAGLATQTLMAKYDGTTGTTHREFEIDLRNSGTQLQYTIWDDSASAGIARYESTTFPTDSWQHIVVRRAGGTTNAAVDIFRNGAEVDDTANDFGSFTEVEDKDSPVQIGHRLDTSGAAGKLFKGQMAGGPLGPWFITGTEPTDAEIKALYDIQRLAIGA